MALFRGPKAKPGAEDMPASRWAAATQLGQVIYYEGAWRRGEKVEVMAPNPSVEYEEVFPGRRLLEDNS